jgi:hypothetical protein
MAPTSKKVKSIKIEKNQSKEGGKQGNGEKQNVVVGLD